MKRLLILVSLSAIGIWLFSSTVIAQAPLAHSGIDPYAGDSRAADTMLRTSTGGFRQQEYLHRVHYPYKQPDGRMQEAWLTARERMNGTAAFRGAGSERPWQPDGPNGTKKYGEEVYYSGRIRDVEVTSNGVVRIGAASGGLWERLGDGSWRPLSDSISSQAIGAFCTNPLNDSILLIGTGEASQRNGTGVWRTDHYGNHWNRIPLDPEVGTCRTIRFDPLDTALVHLAAGEGYYRSTNGGRSFTRILSGEYDDVVPDPVHPGRVFLSKRYDGLYRSESYGDTSSWVRLNGPWDSLVYGRGVLAICPLDPDVIYLNLIRSDDWRTEGIYKSSDGGLSWIRCDIRRPDNSLVGDIHWGQGWYNTLVSVKPDDCDQAWIGGGSLWRSIDGFTFREIDPLHVDQHRMTWAPDGSSAWLANDGGIFYSTEGWFWSGSGSYNNLPIRQYTSFSLGVSDTRVMAGGSQDNGIAIRNPGLSRWQFMIGGDGGAVAISRYDHTRIFVTNGVYGGDLSFRQLESPNLGISWWDINDGISPCGQWWLNVRDNEDGNLYTHCGGKVYYRDFSDDEWEHINEGASFFTTDIWNLNVGAGIPENVYACMGASALRKLLVRDRHTGLWASRTTGLPSDTYVRKVHPDPVLPDRAIALMGGVPPSGDLGRKVFLTEDAGLSWINISGNLPNVPLTDLLQHPKDHNKIYVCGDVGCFYTEDGGLQWSDWSEGLPRHILMTEMGFADSLDINGHLWLYASSYGRAMWKRLIEEEPPLPSGLNASLERRHVPCWPNPTSGMLNGEWPADFGPAEGSLSGKVIAIDGRFLELEISTNTDRIWQMNLPRELDSGMYGWEITSGNRQLYGKVLLTR